jgi:hypothetical protein
MHASAYSPGAFHGKILGSPLCVAKTGTAKVQEIVPQIRQVRPVADIIMPIVEPKRP